MFFEYLPPTVLTAAGLAVIIVEIIKFLYKKITKKPDFVFSLGFYTLLVPILNFLCEPLLYFLGVPGTNLPTNWTLFVQQASQIAVGSLLSFVLYSAGLKPLKNYAYKLKELKDKV